MVEKPLVPIPAVLLFLLIRSVQFLAHGLLSSKYTPEIKQTELRRRAENSQLEIRLGVIIHFLLTLKSSFQ